MRSNGRWWIGGLLMAAGCFSMLACKTSQVTPPPGPPAPGPAMDSSPNTTNPIPDAAPPGLPAGANAHPAPHPAGANYANTPAIPTFPSGPGAPAVPAVNNGAPSAASISSPAAAPARGKGPLKIMPIGDSITEFVKDAVNCPQGYRYEFWKQMVDSGLQFDMVGTHSYQREYGTTYPTYKGLTFDDDADGWGGWTSADILAGVSGSKWGAGQGNLSSWLQTVTPDIVLLHIGTNDSWGGQPVAGVISNIRQIITTIQAANPQVTIYVAEIIPFGSGLASTSGALVPQYNAQIGSLGSLSTSTSAVRVVDQYTGYDPDNDNACDTQYKVHPSVSGAKKIAGKFVAAILADFGAK